MPLAQAGQKSGPSAAVTPMDMAACGDQARNRLFTSSAPVPRLRALSTCKAQGHVLRVHGFRHMLALLCRATIKYSAHLPGAARLACWCGLQRAAGMHAPAATSAALCRALRRLQLGPAQPKPARLRGSRPGQLPRWERAALPRHLPLLALCRARALGPALTRHRGCPPSALRSRTLRQGLGGVGGPGARGRGGPRHGSTTLEPRLGRTQRRAGAQGWRLPSQHLWRPSGRTDFRLCLALVWVCFLC